MDKPRLKAHEQKIQFPGEDYTPDLPLPDIRLEHFAVLISRNVSKRGAVLQSFPLASPSSASFRASRILSDDRVRDRLAYLRAKIAQATQDQSRSASEVNKAIQDVSSLTETNASSAEELSASIATIGEQVTGEDPGLVALPADELQPHRQRVADVVGHLHLDRLGLGIGTHPACGVDDDRVHCVSASILSPPTSHRGHGLLVSNVTARPHTCRTSRWEDGDG